MPRPPAASGVHTIKPSSPAARRASLRRPIRHPTGQRAVPIRYPRTRGHWRYKPAGRRSVQIHLGFSTTFYLRHWRDRLLFRLHYALISPIEQPRCSLQPHCCYTRLSGDGTAGTPTPAPEHKLIWQYSWLCPASLARSEVHCLSYRKAPQSPGT